MSAFALLCGRLSSRPTFVKKSAVATLGVRSGAQVEFWTIRAYPPLMSDLLALAVDDCVSVVGEMQITLANHLGEPIVARGLIIRQLLRLPPALAAAAGEKTAL